MPAVTDTWPRAIILVDMNAFFAAVEQLDDPTLRHRPVAVTNGSQGSCIITCSYEARAFGIKTGMRLKDAQKLCPQLIRCPSRPQRYAELSTTIMDALSTVTPDLEIYSVDEAFLDVTYCQQLHGNPVRIGQLTQQTVWEATKLPCSIGISGDKTTAKFAAKLQKPNGFTVIPPWEAKRRLRHVPVTELCGIAHGIGHFLAKYGVYTCGDMQKLPISILARRFGNLGRRIWYMCQGADPDPVTTKIPQPKSLGHGKVLPPNTRSRDVIKKYLLQMSIKLTCRLRRHNLMAQCFFIGIKTPQGWLGDKFKLAYPTDDTQTLYQLTQKFIQQYHLENNIARQVQITALDPYPALAQGDLFASHKVSQQQLNRTVDAINNRYGQFTITPANLLERTSMPDVISPAWKPSGHRQTIES